jgi:hypothetical protein
MGVEEMDEQDREGRNRFGALTQNYKAGRFRRRRQDLRRLQAGADCALAMRSGRHRRAAVARRGRGAVAADDEQIGSGRCRRLRDEPARQHELHAHRECGKRRANDAPRRQIRRAISRTPNHSGASAVGATLSFARRDFINTLHGCNGADHPSIDTLRGNKIPV